MPRRYSASGSRSVASPTATLMTLTGGTTNRPEIFKGWIGAEATPADNTIAWYLQRTTAAGTSTAFTPIALDSADPASIGATGVNHSSEPTYTANAILFRLGLNQRSTHTLYLEDAPLRIPATANNGIGLYPVHASFTSTVSGTILFVD